MNCPNCQHENRAGAKFCDECGTRLPALCPNCGKAARPQAKFCDECGARLGEAPLAVPVEPARPTPPTPPATPVPIEGERRQTTVILADIKGSTALAEQVDTETWVEMMNDVLQVLANEIYRYGGEVDQFRGDGMVAFFGAKTAHEDDPERAIRAALAMQAAVQTYAADLAERRGVELLLRVGVNTGEVIAASVGNARQHSEDTAMGRAIALAARMESAAEPGTVLVAENTYRLVEPLFEWAALGQIRVKGVSQPVTVYRPLAARAIPGKVRGIAGLESPLVGRDAELLALQEALDRLRAGIGGIVTLVGEAGIGKSRLVAEIRKRALSPDAPSVGEGSARAQGPAPLQWREGRCLSYTANVAYHLWLDMLRGVLGVAPDAPPTAVRDALRERVLALCADNVDEVYPYLGRLLSVPLEARDEEAVGVLAGESLKVITFRAVETLVEAAARQRPLVIACEDLHWADPTSLELLERLLALTDRVPLLFICVFRPETTLQAADGGSWRIRETAARLYRHRHTDLWLDPLTAAESETLVGHLFLSSSLAAEGPALPQSLREQILSYAEGNPLYVEEIIRSLLDGGLVVHDEASDSWQAAGDIAALSIPDTLHGVLMARIDRLPGEARRVLQLASVIGRIFSYRVLEAIAPSPPAPLPTEGEGRSASDSPLPQAGGGSGGRVLDAHLLALQRAQMIRERARVPELEYIFKHHLTQEAAYNSLLRRDRRAIHRGVAEALERLYPGRLEEQVELLAHHWEQAEEPEKAVAYLVKAGQRAAQRYANQEALSFFQSALQHVQPGEETDRILDHRARLYLDMFRGHEAADDYARLLESAARSEDQEAELEALLGLGRAHYIIAFDEPGCASSSLRYYQRAYALARERGDKVSMVRALLPTPWFTDFWSEYRDQALANTEEALALSREIGDQELIIDSMMVAGRVNPPVWREHGDTLVEQLVSRRDLPRLNQAYFELMWGHLAWGNLVQCVQTCDAGIHLAAEIGVPPVQYPTLKALALLFLGRYVAAWEALAQEVADEAHQLGAAFQGFGRGTCLLEWMAYEGAAERFAEAIEQASRIGRAWLSDWARVQWARSLIRAGPIDRAGLQRVVQDLEGMNAWSTVTDWLGEPGVVLGEIALVEGDPERALPLAQAACAHTQGFGCWIGYLSALELQLGALLRLGRTGEVLPLADAGIRRAEEIGARPMLWRIRALKAQALAALGQVEAATGEYQAAAAILLPLADEVPDAELRRNYLSSALVSSILAASRGS
jgi:class 3 adenylate cyclase/tetratricopeptide (TPR) repeat protein